MTTSSFSSQTPYPLISLSQKQPQTISGLTPLLIHTRTFESLTFEFSRDRDAEDVFQTVKELTVARSITNLYAFYYQPSPPLPSSNGWNVYNPRDEFARMGVGSRTKAWRFTDVNKDYEYSPTYPAKLVVPAKISDAVLAYAGRYRSKARIPALTYLHWANHASITRSSQPLVGLKNARSAQDERLIESIFQSHISPQTSFSPALNDHTPSSASPSRNPLGAIRGSLQGDGPAQVYGATATNLIVDARPTTNALANTAKGAGTENMENYRLARKVYLGIDNIHVMRNSLNQLMEALREGSTTGIIDKHMLRRSNWLKHISALLDGALIITRNIHINSSHVLIHCSDGWDRTTQLSSLAQLCLDPYYRTFKGFQVLIDKDWLSFGHKFLDRCGHLSSDKFFTTIDEDPETVSNGAERAALAFFSSVQKQFASSAHVKETSPVFHQFLDCVWQIHRQFPERFEFNEKLLEDLHYHLYSCQFGTFVANTEKQRKTAFVDEEIGDLIFPICQQTISLWDYLDSRKAEYLNPIYDATLDNTGHDPTSTDMGVLLVDPRNVRYWHKLFRRTDEEMNGSRPFLDQQAQGVEIQGIVTPTEADPVNDASMADVVDGIASTVLADSLATSTLMAPSRQSRHNENEDQLLSQSQNQSPHRASRTFRTESPTLASSSYSSTSAVGGGGGWGWSQISSGARTAFQGAAKELQIAAKEIKSFSTETYNQLSAAGLDDNGSRESKAQIGSSGKYGGEMRDNGGWNNVRHAASTSMTTQSTASTRIPSRRLPSENNPWAVEDDSTAPQLPAYEPSQRSIGSSSSSGQPSQIPGVNYLASSSQLWGSQADHRQQGSYTRQPVSSAADFVRTEVSSPPTTLPTVDASLSTQPNILASAAEKTDVSPSSGPAKRPDNWDPLGAL